MFLVRAFTATLFLSASLVANAVDGNHTRQDTCANFAGSYGSAEEGRLEIKQIGCEGLTALYTYPQGSSFERTMHFDDVMREVFNHQGIVARESSYLKKDTIIFHAEVYYPIGYTEYSRGKIFFEAGRFVEETVFLDSNGEPRRIGRSIYERIGTGPELENNSMHQK